MEDTSNRNPFEAFTRQNILLGKGAYGEVEVVTVEENSGPKTYAMKSIKVQNVPNHGDMIEREAEISMSLKHPNILKSVHTSFKPEAQMLLLFMEKGESSLVEVVDDTKSRGQVMKQDDIINYVKDICLGLRYMFSRRISHRDLKLQNIILVKEKDQQGKEKLTAKLADFGFAKMFDGIRSENLTCSIKGNVGTKGYWSPELHRRKKLQTAGLSNSQEPGFDFYERADLWALGVVIYFLCNLELPPEIDLDKLKDYPKRITFSKDRYERYPTLADIVRRLLDPEPKAPMNINAILSELGVNTSFSPVLLNKTDTDIPLRPVRRTTNIQHLMVRKKAKKLTIVLDSFGRCQTLDLANYQPGDIEKLSITDVHKNCSANYCEVNINHVIGPRDCEHGQEGLLIADVQCSCKEFTTIVVFKDLKAIGQICLEDDQVIRKNVNSKNTRVWTDDTYLVRQGRYKDQLYIIKWKDVEQMSSKTDQTDVPKKLVAKMIKGNSLNAEVKDVAFDEDSNIAVLTDDGFFIAPIDETPAQQEGRSLKSLAQKLGNVNWKHIRFITRDFLLLSFDKADDRVKEQAHWYCIISKTAPKEDELKPYHRKIKNDFLKGEIKFLHPVYASDVQKIFLVLCESTSCYLINCSIYPEKSIDFCGQINLDIEAKDETWRILKAAVSFKQDKHDIVEAYVATKLRVFKLLINPNAK